MQCLRHPYQSKVTKWLRQDQAVHPYLGQVLQRLWYPYQNQVLHPNQGQLIEWLGQGQVTKWFRQGQVMHPCHGQVIQCLPQDPAMKWLTQDPAMKWPPQDPAMKWPPQDPAMKWLSQDQAMHPYHGQFIKCLWYPYQDQVTRPQNGQFMSWPHRGQAMLWIPQGQALRGLRPPYHGTPLPHHQDWVRHWRCDPYQMRGMRHPHNGKVMHHQRTSGKQYDGIVMSDQPIQPGFLYQVLISEIHKAYMDSPVGVVTMPPDTYRPLPKDFAILDRSVLCVDVDITWEFKRAIFKKTPLLRRIPLGSKLGLALDLSGNLHLYINEERKGIVGLNVPSPCYFFLDMVGYLRGAT
ncbi:hypothetical protein ACOMHN_020147 [Nucella lapillus]